MAGKRSAPQHNDSEMPPPSKRVTRAQARAQINTQFVALDDRANPISVPSRITKEKAPKKNSIPGKKTIDTTKSTTRTAKREPAPTPQNIRLKLTMPASQDSRPQIQMIHSGTQTAHSVRAGKTKNLVCVDSSTQTTRDIVSTKPEGPTGSNCCATLKKIYQHFRVTGQPNDPDSSAWRSDFTSQGRDHLHESVKALFPRQGCQPASVRYHPAVRDYSLDIPSQGGVVESLQTYQRLRLGADNSKNDWAFVKGQTDKGVGFLVSQDGGQFPHRYPGPVWGENSCAYDALCFVLLQLNVNLTDGDYDILRVSRLEGAVAQVTAKPWHLLSEAERTRRRDELRDSIIDEYNSAGGGQITKSDTVDFNEVAAIALRDFDQFVHVLRFRYECEHCQIVEIPDDAIMTNDGIQVYQIGQTMSDAWDDYLNLTVLEKDCDYCKKKMEHQKVLDSDPPPRIYLSLPGSVQNLNPTVEELDERRETIEMHRKLLTEHEHTIEYLTTDPDEGPRIATYRWIGMVSSSGMHFRSFWIDSEFKCTGSDRTVRMYDGMAPAHVSESNGELNCYSKSNGYWIRPVGACGAVIGGIPLDEIPDEWIECPVAMFFERVDLAGDADSSSGLTANSGFESLDLDEVEGSVDSL